MLGVRRFSLMRNVWWSYVLYTVLTGRPSWLSVYTVCDVFGFLYVFLTSSLLFFFLYCIFVFYILLYGMRMSLWGGLLGFLTYSGRLSLCVRLSFRCVSSIVVEESLALSFEICGTFRVSIVFYRVKLWILIVLYKLKPRLSRFLVYRKLWEFI